MADLLKYFQQIFQDFVWSVTLLKTDIILKQVKIRRISQWDMNSGNL